LGFYQRPNRKESSRSYRFLGVLPQLRGGMMVFPGHHHTNVFLATGNLLHVIAIILLLHRIFIVKNAQGLSRKTQELYLLVFVTRYADLYANFGYVTFYQSFLKIVYVSSTGIIVLALTVRNQVQGTYRSEQDGFSHWKHLALPCFVVGFFIQLVASASTYEFDFTELLWTVSILLETVATLPQILMYRKYREVESLTGGTFIVLMASYRFMYVLNWIYRTLTERRYRHHWLLYSCAVVQVALGFVGFCWLPQNGSSTAPLLPQLQRVWEGMQNEESKRFFCFTVVFPTTVYVVGMSLPTIDQDLPPAFAFVLFQWLFAVLAFAVQRLIVMRHPTEPNTISQWCTQLRDHVFVDRPTVEARAPVESFNVLMTEPLLGGNNETQLEDILPNEPQDEWSPDIRVV